MSYIALYRKWRPLSFDDVIEQTHITQTLKNSILTNRIAHAYLFCGSRGTGKTSLAKIFARAVNCIASNNGNPCNVCNICNGILSETILDVIEIDAASNNGVDNIREIRDEVIYTPSIAKYKVYIIDEVHMLSSGAFNALLKTLEEPPAHVIFILATTEPHKLPATILSRCQKFQFHKISLQGISNQLTKIANKNNVELNIEAANIIANISDGAMRDAISILDQCMSISSENITPQDVLSIIGLPDKTFIENTAMAILEKNIEKILLTIAEVYNEGKDLSYFINQLINFFRDLLIFNIAPNEKNLLKTENYEQFKNHIINKNFLMQILQELSSLETNIKWSSQPKILLETGLIKLCSCESSDLNINLLQKINKLEEELKSLMNNSIKPDISNSKSDVSKKTLPKEPSKNNIAPKITYKNILPLDILPAILKKLKADGKMILYTNMLDCSIVELTVDMIGIVFDLNFSFCKLLISRPENLNILEDIISGILNKNVSVKCLLKSDLESNASKSSASDDNLINKTKSLANNLNISLDIIE